MPKLDALGLRGGVIIALDACVCNPYKKFKRKDEPGQRTIMRLISELCERFSVINVISTASAIGSYQSSSAVLDWLEQEAYLKQAVVILVTRDYGFAEDAGWRAEQSLVCIYFLPREFFGKTVDQYTRVTMIRIIFSDIAHLKQYGNFLFAEYFYAPQANARAA